MQNILKDKDIIIDYITKCKGINYSYVNYLSITNWDRIILGKDYVSFHNKDSFFSQKLLVDKFLVYKRLKKLEKICGKCKIF